MKGDGGWGMWDWKIWRITDSPLKNLLRSFAIIGIGTIIIPDNHWMTHVVVANEALKMYRLWAEGRALDKKFKADMKKYVDDIKKWQIASQN
jgi:hypothetical protein